MLGSGTEHLSSSALRAMQERSIVASTQSMRPRAGAELPPAASRPLWVVVFAAGLIVAVTIGLRQVMGLYLPPVTQELDRKSTRLNSSHIQKSRMPSSA